MTVVEVSQTGGVFLSAYYWMLLHGSTKLLGIANINGKYNMKYITL